VQLLEHFVFLEHLASGFLDHDPKIESDMV
jgi:hypothetical protein